MSVSFDVTASEDRAIQKIVGRAATLARREGSMPLDRQALAMDITAVHANGCLLDLDRLLAFPEFDFAHDVFGIVRHIDRSTGKLGGYFLPRCARGER